MSQKYLIPLNKSKLPHTSLPYSSIASQSLSPHRNTISLAIITCAATRRCHNYRLADAGNLKQTENCAAAQDSSTKVKRKKLKGKRAVVRWLKHFRYKKKKEFQRMTSEEKILFKLNKWSEATHDPEVLTPEEHFYFLKMGLKCKNYVPVGRRGIYQGIILNIHLHWKKHQTLQVIVKTFTPVEVKEIAIELARLTGGIVLDIQEEYTIIMYRGKNYAQPPTEIMSPRVTLPRKKGEKRLIETGTSEEASTSLSERLKSSKSSEKGKERSQDKSGYGGIRYRRYNIEEIKMAKDSFSESLKIGEGGYGPVFKCYLDHTKVAVKVL